MSYPSTIQNRFVTESILKILKDFSTENHLCLNRQMHVDFCRNGLIKSLSSGYVCLDASRPWLCYWMLHSLQLLQPDLLTKSSIRRSAIKTLKECWREEEGGFGGSSHQIAHLASSYASIMSICILKAYKAENAEGSEETFASLASKMKDFLKTRRGNHGYKSFTMHDDGEQDMRAVYCAISIGYLLNILDADLVTGIIDFIAASQTEEGGFGACPGTEAHGGYSYCAIASIALLLDSELVNLEQVLKVISLSKAAEFVKMMQCSKTGAFRGRSHKLVDVCYSFWQVAQVPLLETMGVHVDIDWNSLVKYILLVSQDAQKGGFRDKPGKQPDFYHTCYALSGLSIAMYQINEAESLPKIDIRLNTLTENVQSMRLYFTAFEYDVIRGKA